MLLLQQMIIMFLLMSVGFVGSKIGMITEETSKRLSAIVVNIANPAMILVSGISDERMEGRELLSLTVVILAIYAVLLLLAYLLPVLLRVDPKSRGIYQAMTVFSNIGFMGYPIIAALYGSSAVLYGALYSIPFNILIYTFGVSALRKKENGAEKKKLSLKEVLNIGVITSVISLILYLWQIRVPGFLTDTLSYLGNLTAPLSMMVIGASMTSISLRELFTDVRLLLFSLIKLLLIPVFGMLLIRQVVTNEVICGVFMIMLATPAGSMTAMLAQEYDGDYETASRGVTLTTLLSVITMPVVSLLLF